jgi:hypothetical protein
MRGKEESERVENPDQEPVNPKQMRDNNQGERPILKGHTSAPTKGYP